MTTSMSGLNDLALAGLSNLVFALSGSVSGEQLAHQNPINSENNDDKSCFQLLLKLLIYMCKSTLTIFNIKCSSYLFQAYVSKIAATQERVKDY